MPKTDIISLGGASRRSFIGKCAAAASLPLLSSLPVNVFAAQGDKPLKVGVIGAGGRGTGAAENIRQAAKASNIPVEIWAVGDVFKEQSEAFAKKNHLPAERTFDGFDNHTKVLESGVDIVILTAPPGFRPLHFRAAIEKGVHVFAEKAVAVDPIGAKDFIVVGEMAAAKKLSVVAGTQRRHQQHYIEMMKRIHDGEIGEIVSAQCYWCQGGLWHKQDAISGDDMSDMRYQLRNWLYFTWLSGDHIVEQHVHNIDIVNWAIQANPSAVFGMGGRQTRVEKKYGDAFDHFSVDFEYPNGVRIESFCRQAQGSNDRNEERIVGTKGVASLNSRNGHIQFYGTKDRKPVGHGSNGYVQEHIDLLRSIRGEIPYMNEARTVAESSLDGVMGRVSAYTGKKFTRKWLLEGCGLDLFPKQFAFGAGTAPAVEVAIPGKTPLVNLAKK